MTCGSPNTSEATAWSLREEALLASLRNQPLLIVVRPDASDLQGASGSLSLLSQVRALHAAGLRHLEVAWVDSPAWPDFVRGVRAECPDLQLGAASLTRPEALKDVQACGLPFGMSPCFDPELLALAREMGLLLVPGVFSPTELLQATQQGCRLVKLFPAVQLGVGYVNSLRGPLGPLPQVIAAGGLGVDDLEPWLEAGHAAVALGRRVIGAEGIDRTLLRWLLKARPECYR